MLGKIASRWEWNHFEFVRTGTSKAETGSLKKIRTGLSGMGDVTLRKAKQKKKALGPLGSGQTEK